MSLKVPRGFVTHSEEAIADQYAKMRTLHVRQDLLAKRRHDNALAWSMIGRLAVKAVAVITVLALARPAWNLVQTFL